MFSLLYYNDILISFRIHLINVTPPNSIQISSIKYSNKNGSKGFTQRDENYIYKKAIILHYSALYIIPPNLKNNLSYIKLFWNFAPDFLIRLSRSLCIVFALEPWLPYFATTKTMYMYSMSHCQGSRIYWNFKKSLIEI